MCVLPCHPPCCEHDYAVTPKQRREVDAIGRRNIYRIEAGVAQVDMQILGFEGKLGRLLRVSAQMTASKMIATWKSNTTRRGIARRTTAKRSCGLTT